MREHIVWENIDTPSEEWLREIMDEYECDNDEAYEMALNMNREYLDDERMNLNVKTATEIVAIGDFGLWNGRVQGYKIIGNNVADCLYTECDYVKWYVDNRGDFRFVGHHHDGTNYTLYRVFKDNISETQKENFLDKLYYGKATRKDITRYTRKLREVCEVYGW